MINNSALSGLENFTFRNQDGVSHTRMLCHLQRLCGALGGLREDSLLPQSSVPLSVLP